MSDMPSRPLRELGGFVVAGAGAFLLLALASFDPRDYAARAFPVLSEVRNLGGGPGRALAGLLFDWVGIFPSYALGAAMVIAGLRFRRAPAPASTPAPAPADPADVDSWPALAFTRPLGLFALLIGVATVEHLLHRAGALPGESFLGRNPGGYWGSFLAGTMLRSLEPAAVYGIAALGGLLGLVLATDLDLRLSRRAGAFAGGPRLALVPVPAGAAPLTPLSAPRPALAHALVAVPVPVLVPASAPAPSIRIGPVPAEAPASAPTFDDSGSGPVATPPPAPAALAAPPAIEEPEDLVEPEPEPAPAAASVAPAADPDEDGVDPLPPGRPRQLGLFQATGEAGIDGADSYALPPLTMLTPAEAGPAEEYEAVMREKAQVLEKTLQSFKVDARVIAVERGPNITQFELELASGVKVHRIMSLGDDLALAMKAQSIRIIAPIPGKSTVGVEVPNQDQDTVRLRELLESDEYGKKDYAIPLFLGKDSTGNPLIADLARMPHLLIAGATGSGKSVCMNTIITSILMTRKPQQVKMILIDPKMVELSLYESIPHLLAPVVTDMRKAPSVLEWAVNKMEERYGLLSRVAVRHIKNYNALGAAEIATRLGLEEADLPEQKIPFHLPYIVVVIDEFADLMCVARKEVEGSIIRLAQKSRAVGIHLLLATQRPTADVITGLIKSNMPCRIAFQVASKVDSRTIIDKNGAEMLVGQGDMLYLPPGTAHVIRSQGTYVSEDEVKAIVKFTRNAATPEFHPELVKWEAGEGGGGEGGEEDELFDAAVRIILESQRGSASLLQRRLEIGYSRASRLIDIMTERGLLGPFKGSKAREILMSLEDWDAMKAREKDGG